MDNKLVLFILMLILFLLAYLTGWPNITGNAVRQLTESFNVGDCKNIMDANVCLSAIKDNGDADVKIDGNTIHVLCGDADSLGSLYAQVVSYASNKADIYFSDSLFIPKDVNCNSGQLIVSQPAPTVTPPSQPVTQPKSSNWLINLFKSLFGLK